MNWDQLQIWSNIGLVIGGVLVVVAGFGNFYAGRRLDDQRERQADARADERTASLKRNIGELVESNQKLERELTPFKTLAEKIYPNFASDIALERLHQDFGLLQKRTDAIEKKTTPRALSDSDKNKLMELLKTMDKVTVGISTVMGDAEATDLAEEIADCFRSIGWDVRGVSQGVFTQVPRGVIVGVGTPPPAAAQKFGDFLLAKGIWAKGEVVPDMGSKEISIVVGAKP